MSFEYRPTPPILVAGQEFSGKNWREAIQVFALLIDGPTHEIPHPATFQIGQVTLELNPHTDCFLPPEHSLRPTIFPFFWMHALLCPTPKNTPSHSVCGNSITPKDRIYGGSTSVLTCWCSLCIRTTPCMSKYSVHRTNLLLFEGKVIKFS